jgi:hypothetical protein
VVQKNLDFGTGILSGGGGLTVDFEQLVGVELGGLEDLDLADKDVLKGVDSLALLLDVFANTLRDACVVRISCRWKSYNLVTKSLSSQVVASRVMISIIFFLIWRI